MFDDIASFGMRIFREIPFVISSVVEDAVTYWSAAVLSLHHIQHVLNNRGERDWKAQRQNKGNFRDVAAQLDNETLYILNLHELSHSVKLWTLKFQNRKTKHE